MPKGGNDCVHTYGSDPFAYDFAAALADATSSPAVEPDERANELAYLERMAPRPEFKPDGEVVALKPPTIKQLERHRKKFEPIGRAFATARKHHRQACDEVTKLYGFGADSLEAKVLELRRDGLSPVTIADRLGASEASVRKVLRAA
ncbi:MAG TPA: hypothetical protein VFJ93_06215 [Gaiellaceae bacterium]|jgi:DNA-binding CsgD family transcriptional regulator|nr:hypothetical protein [Gaiellaceae bacterium]